MDTKDKYDKIEELSRLFVETVKALDIEFSATVVITRDGRSLVVSTDTPQNVFAGLAASWGIPIIMDYSPGSVTKH